jgi:hypothetical protein
VRSTFGKGRSSSIIEAVEEELAEEIEEGVGELLAFGSLPLRFLGLFASTVGSTVVSSFNFTVGSTVCSTVCSSKVGSAIGSIVSSTSTKKYGNTSNGWFFRGQIHFK